MKITETNIDFIKPIDGLIGFASVVIDNDIYLSSIAIHKRLNVDGYRLTYPEKSGRSVFYPINKQASHKIEQAIFEKLKNVMSRLKHDRYSNTTNP
jgi:stage V sporulation protein G